MNKIKINTIRRKALSDTITPIGLYLKLRDKFCKSFLLESSDYHGSDNNFSFICLEPIASFIVEKEVIEINQFGDKRSIPINEGSDVMIEFRQLLNCYDINQEEGVNGFFGHTNYDAVKYFETVTINNRESHNYSTPEMHYCFFRYIVQIDHFRNEMMIIENLPEGKESNIDTIEALVKSNIDPNYYFELKGEEKTNISDDYFKDLVSKGKEHCQKGDVFQVVFSRQFSQQFKGDEFNVYRALRSVNPSPYLFYFDYGNYKLFGSSPEAQIKLIDRKVTINPIAGTFKRTGNDLKDEELAKSLAKDPKENAEHTMLVDLARNDLGKHGENIKVKKYKEVQFYSHVIHLVSEVEANLQHASEGLEFFADTFPAGTLSGAPKHRAIQLIEKYENQNRGFYGGAIGIFGFDGSINHAITIRSFLSKNNTLFFQAGAGVVVDSIEEKELEEVNNKLTALKKALVLAQKI